MNGNVWQFFLFTIVCCPSTSPAMECERLASDKIGNRMIISEREPDGRRWSSAFRSIERRNLAELAAYCEHKGFVDESGEKGWSLLYKAVEAGWQQGIHYLLEHGATVNIKPGILGMNDTPLTCAAQMGRVNIVKLLINTGQCEQNSALHRAGANGHVEICRMLLERGANIESRSTSGCTALMCAVSFLQIPAIVLLLDKGADIDVTGTDHLTLIEQKTYGPVTLLPKLISLLVSRFIFLDPARRQTAQKLSHNLPAWREKRAHAVARLKEVFERSPYLPDDNHRKIICDIVLACLCKEERDTANSDCMSGAVLV